MPSRKEVRLTLRCDLCAGSAKPGYLWLGGKDYVECPQCDGSARMELVEAVVTPGLQFASAGIPSLTRVEIR